MATYTVMEKAVLEHNIEVISTIYKNITFYQFGKFLSIDPEAAEEIISQMVGEGRINACLDQLNKSIDFGGNS
jgi:COP9 signalosome complex subunit 4